MAFQPNGLKMWTTLKRKIVTNSSNSLTIFFQSRSIFSIRLAGGPSVTDTLWNFCPYVLFRTFTNLMVLVDFLKVLHSKTGNFATVNRSIICRDSIIADYNQKRCRKRFWQKCGHVTFSHIIIAIVFILIIIILWLSSLTVPGPPRSIKAVVSGPSSVVVSWLPPERPAGQVIQVQHTTFGLHHLCFFLHDHFLGHIKISI